MSIYFIFQNLQDEPDVYEIRHKAYATLNEVEDMEYFKDDLFFIEDDQFYMYKQNGDWHCHDRYCFIKPVAKEESFLYKNFKDEPLVGLVKYANNYLKSQGVNSGDKITFKPDSEYVFIIMQLSGGHTFCIISLHLPQTHIHYQV